MNRFPPSKVRHKRPVFCSSSRTPENIQPRSGHVALRDLVCVYRCVSGQGSFDLEFPTFKARGRARVVELKDLMISTPGQDRHAGFPDELKGSPTM